MSDGVEVYDSKRVRLRVHMPELAPGVFVDVVATTADGGETWTDREIRISGFADRPIVAGPWLDVGRVVEIALEAFERRYGNA